MHIGLKDLLHSRILQTAIALWLAYPLLAWHLDTEKLFAVLNGIAVAMSIAVIIAYWEGVHEALTTRSRDAGHILLLGVVCGWGGLFARQAAMWLWRWAGEPAWVINHKAFGFISVLVISAGALHLSARGAINNQIPRRNFVILGITVAVGVLIGMLTVTFWPEPNPDIMSPGYDVVPLRPYATDDWGPIPPLELRPVTIVPGKGSL
jgi:hypothetical protein